jgi:excisionase family DNA binding protein
MLLAGEFLKSGASGAGGKIELVRASSCPGVWKIFRIFFWLVIFLVCSSLVAGALSVACIAFILCGMDTSPDFWTVAELAEAARVSPSFIRKEISLGRVPSVMFGTAHRIPRDAAEAFLRGGSARVRRLKKRPPQEEVEKV